MTFNFRSKAEMRFHLMIASLCICGAHICLGQTLEVLGHLGPSSGDAALHLADDGTLVVVDGAGGIRLPNGEFYANGPSWIPYAVTVDGSLFTGKAICCMGCSETLGICPTCPDGDPVNLATMATWDSPLAVPSLLLPPYCCPQNPGHFGQSGSAFDPISDDGTVVVATELSNSGCGESMVWQAVAWQNGVFTTLSNPMSLQSIASGVSGDGNVIVGALRDGADWTSARWVDGKYEDLGGGRYALIASFDGTVIAGESGDSDTNPFRWTAESGYQELSCGESQTRSMTADGSIIVGYGVGSGGSSYIWDEVNGCRNFVAAMIDDYDIDMSESAGWTTVRTRQVSSDGTKFAGSGYLEGEYTHWLINVDPCAIDTDEDGLPNCWETTGIPYTDNEGVEQYYVLPDADPFRRDLYVEVDLMDTVSFLPAFIPTIPPELATGTSLDYVIEAFDIAPVEGPPDHPLNTGVALHILIDDQNLPYVADWPSDPGESCWPMEFYSYKNDYVHSPPSTTNGWFGTFDERNDPEGDLLLNAKRKAYRYCIGTATIGGGCAAGVAEVGGDDFVMKVAFQPFCANAGNGYPADCNMPGTVPDDERNALSQASTFMHELGHNLGLRHGGASVDEVCDVSSDPNCESTAVASLNNKPNYISVMNYTLGYPFEFSYSASGLPEDHDSPPDGEIDSYGFWRLDYSRWPSFGDNRVGSLLEWDLDESVGVPAPPELLNVWMPHDYMDQYGYDSKKYFQLGGPVDWNGDGDTDDAGLVADVIIDQINGNDLLACNQGLACQGLQSHDDWSALKYEIVPFTGFGPPVYPIELTEEEILQLDETLAIPRSCAANNACSDLDDDGIRDDNCTWSVCDTNVGICSDIETEFADIGGPFGDCAVDGTADGNDRFHAINCFANIDPNNPAPATYPCEDDPPNALNIDAGGPFGQCCPDGVCDGNDAFHALNAFAGENPCQCPANFACPCPAPTEPPENPVLCPANGGPAPEIAGGPAVIARTGITLVPSRRRVRPGDILEIDLFLDDTLPDLRGYQLHLDAPQRDLELVDIAIHDRRDHALAGYAHWTAFNVTTGQMLAGMDESGVATSQRGYLATFVYRVRPDASGRVAIDLRADPTERTDRTFLFPTRPGEMIAIGKVDPAVITIGSRTVSTTRE